VLRGDLSRTQHPNNGSDGVLQSFCSSFFLSFGVLVQGRRISLIPFKYPRGRVRLTIGVEGLAMLFNTLFSIFVVFIVWAGRFGYHITSHSSYNIYFQRYNTIVVADSADVKSIAAHSGTGAIGAPIRRDSGQCGRVTCIAPMARGSGCAVSLAWSTRPQHRPPLPTGAGLLAAKPGTESGATSIRAEPGRAFAKSRYGPRRRVQTPLSKSDRYVSQRRRLSIGGGTWFPCRSESDPLGANGIARPIP